MQEMVAKVIITEQLTLWSAQLGRDVIMDCYLPRNIGQPENLPLLLVNDGQDLPKFMFDEMLEEMIASNVIEPLIVVAIYCGDDRKNEYGTAFITDYQGRGTKALAYKEFIFSELLPFIRNTYKLPQVREKAFAGFSLGALSAMDIVWNNPSEFSKTGLFSGSFWWRTKEVDDTYTEDLDRIMHQQVRAGTGAPWLKFFFQCGTDDEAADRNNNGVIDSIDDTRDLIDELVGKGYTYPGHIHYYEMEGGRHDVPTWGRAMPVFLKWGWGLALGDDEAS
jgi:enterochelin esterase-like enzyme